jgi:hypothetical protein
MTWDNSRDGDLIGLRMEGFSQSEIALEMRTSRGAISGRLARLRRAGLVKPKGPPSGRPRPLRPVPADIQASNDEAHVARCLAQGGFPVLNIQVRR